MTCQKVAKAIEWDGMPSSSPMFLNMSNVDQVAEE